MRSERSVGRARSSAGSAGTVLRTVLDQGPIARSTIARITGLSPATVSTASSQLLDYGLLRELPEIAGPTGLGRPHVPVTLDENRYIVYGIHLAFTHVTTALVNLRGDVLARRRSLHTGRAPGEVLVDAMHTLNAMSRELDEPHTVLGVGFAAGGWVDSESGFVREHPIEVWRGYPVQVDLERLSGLPVRVDSHARALIDAEVLFGDRRARNSVVYLFVGNVVDAGFSTGGVVHRGPHAAAGAVAHGRIEDSAERCLCGRTGCVEATVSNRTIANHAVAQGIIDHPVFDDVLAAATNGHGGALRLLTSRAYLVGVVAANLLDLIDPEVLIVCEQGSNTLPQCFDELKRGVAETSVTGADPDISVARTSFPGRSLPVSAGAVILAELYRAPLDSFISPLATAW